jgi:hypothetical protein
MSDQTSVAVTGDTDLRGVIVTADDRRINAATSQIGSPSASSRRELTRIWSLGTLTRWSGSIQRSFSSEPTTSSPSSTVSVVTFT